MYILYTYTHREREREGYINIDRDEGRDAASTLLSEIDMPRTPSPNEMGLSDMGMQHPPSITGVATCILSAMKFAFVFRI